MKAVHAIAAASALFLLAGFSEEKREELIAHCVEQGSEREVCACSFDVIGKRAGDAYLEIVHLQISGRMTEAQVALLRMVSEDPKSIDVVAAAGEEAKRACSK